MPGFTLTLTLVGARAIATLTVGDYGAAYDPQTGTASSQTVEATTLHHDANLGDVTLRVTTPAPTSAPSTTKTVTAPSAKTASGKTATMTHTEVVHTAANHPWRS